LKPIIGFDIGGVIIDRVNDGTDTSFFGDNYLQTTPVPGAIETIRKLCVEMGLLNQIHFISKCGSNTERKTREWLRERNAFTNLGLNEETQLHFCRDREGKAPICANLGITHYFDDRLEISGKILKGVVPHCYLINPNENEIAKYKQYLESVPLVTWNDVIPIVETYLQS
jgi:hypothetical protein